MQLRQYQKDAIEALWAYYSRSDAAGNALICAPTGSGKSLICADIVRRLAGETTGSILIVSHVKEIIEQNARKIMALCPDLKIGIYSAGLREKRIRRVTVAGIQSIYRKAATLEKVSVVIVDECHFIPRDGNGMYIRLLKELKKTNPNLVVIGLTATPFRMSTGLLTEGSDALFNEIVYDISIVDLIRDGYLSPLITRAPETQISVEGVGKRGGEFIESELRKAVEAQDITDAILDDVFKHARDRKSWLFFCASVRLAHETAEKLIARGVITAVVTGDTLPLERSNVLSRFKNGGIEALVNVDVLTTGFDAPNIDMIAMLRPTMSPGLYVQMLGRGMRPSEGKKDCLVLDFAGNIFRHGPVDDINDRIKAKEKGEGLAPVKVCSACSMVCYAGVRRCPSCGYEFPPPAPEEKLYATADIGTLISGIGDEAKPLEVSSVGYTEHVSKRTGLLMMRVNYDVGFRTISDYVCFEHQGFARRKAVNWWYEAGGEDPAPDTVADALERQNELMTPVEIVAWKDKNGYTQVLSRTFDQARAEFLREERLRLMDEIGV